VSDLRIVFVLSPYQNAFFGELSEAIGDGLTAAGLSVVTTTDPGLHEIGPGDVFVLMPPHEYVALEGAAFVDDEAVAARTIGISAEQPHQGFFERNAAIGGQLGAVIDFSPLAVAAYRQNGIDARHLPFGYVPGWDRVDGHVGERTVTTPVLYMGNKRERRLSVLAVAADALVHQRARLIVSDNDEPNRFTSPSFVAGDAKRALLGETGLLVNIHQSDEPYFEWLRFVEATHCGVPVLSEVSLASDPFVDGTHFLSFEREELGPRLDEVMADEAGRRAVAQEAYDLLRKIPLANGIEVLVDAARELLIAPPPTALPARLRSAPIGRDRTNPAPAGLWRAPRRAGPRRLFRSSRWTLLAPPGTALAVDLDVLVADHGDRRFLNLMAHGFDASGEPMLEGHWPWEPWRLLQGQHLGRVMVVDTDLMRAAIDWVDDPVFGSYPWLAVQLFAATHGMAGAHWPNPAAELAVPVEPHHQLSERAAQRCRDLLGAPT
jgi:hypothetical protein